LRSAGILDHPVDRHELGNDDRAHHLLLSLAVSRRGQRPRPELIGAEKPRQPRPAVTVGRIVEQVLDAPPAEPRLVGTARPRTSRISQIVMLVAVIVPPLGLLMAMGLLWGVAFHPVDAVLLAGMYVLCAFGTTIGFHRYFTHRGFEAGT